MTDIAFPCTMLRFRFWLFDDNITGESAIGNRNIVFERAQGVPNLLHHESLKYRTLVDVALRCQVTVFLWCGNAPASLLQWARNRVLVLSGFNERTRDFISHVFSIEPILLEGRINIVVSACTSFSAAKATRLLRVSSRSIFLGTSRASTIVLCAPSIVSGISPHIHNILLYCQNT